MRKLLRFWPVYLLILVYILSWYNIDYFAVPTLLGLGLKKNLVLLVTGTWGFADMLAAYVGWSRFRDLLGIIFQEDINFMKKVAGEAEARGLWEKIKVHLAREHFKVSEKTDLAAIGRPQSFFSKIKNKLLKITVSVLKGGSYFLIFLIGFLPVPGLRMFADIICGTARLRKQFLIIALGNFLKTVCFVYGWNHYFS